MKNKQIVFLIGNFSILIFLVLSIHAQKIREPWSKERIWEWYNKNPWICGFNYIPANAINYTAMWDKTGFSPDAIDRELALADTTGFNAVREDDPGYFKDSFERFLSICTKHNIRVVPIFFDDCVFSTNRDPHLGKQPEPFEGWYAWAWSPSPGHSMVMDTTTYPRLEKYVKDIIGTYKNNKAILFWDLYNEPTNGGLGKNSLPLVRNVFKWAREINPSQPLTIGYWNNNSELNSIILTNSDVITFHSYLPKETVKNLIQTLRQYERPVICTEWLNRPRGSTVEGLLPLFYEEDIWCFHWGLVNGKTQTHLPWGHRPGDGPYKGIWQHDLYTTDFKMYSPYELEIFKSFITKSKIREIQEKSSQVPKRMPVIKPLFEQPLRDPSICIGPDGTYYLTGTTGNNPGGISDTTSWWYVNEGIRIWKSKDLKKWEPLGLVWSLDKDATWAREFKSNRGALRRALWAPEIFYFRGTFWLTYSMNYGGCGLLKSITGKPEGPYIDVKADGPLTDKIDASLFLDDDGKVYFIYQNGMIARMNDDLTGLAEEPRLLKPANYKHVGFEGAFMTKYNGKYILLCAEVNERDGFRAYDCMSAVADNIYGPYSDRYLAIPHGGHNMLFKTKDGKWMSTFFGSDEKAAFRERPGILPIEFDLNGHFKPLMKTFSTTYNTK